MLRSSLLPRGPGGLCPFICSFSLGQTWDLVGSKKSSFKPNCIAAAEGLRPGVSATGTGSGTGLPVLRVPGLALTITQVYVTWASHFLCLKVSLKSPRLEKTN